MSFIYLIKTVLIFLVLFILKTTHTTSVGRSHDQVRQKDQQSAHQTKAQISTKTLHDTLVSIDERLRLLEAYDNTYKLTRLDYKLEELSAKAHSIDSRLLRFEAKFDSRLANIENIALDKDAEEEFTSESITRKIEELNDKLTNKVEQIETNVNKKIDQIIAKLDSIEKFSQSNGEELESKLIKYHERHAVFESHIRSHISNIENLVKHSLDASTNIKHIVNNNFESLVKLNNSLRNCDQSKPTIESQMNEFISTLVKNLNQSLIPHESLQQSYEKQNNEFIDDNNNNNLMTANTESQKTGNTNKNNSRSIGEMTSSVENENNITHLKLSEVNAQVEYYSRKIINAIQELWRSSQSSESYLREALDMANKTRSFIRQEFIRLQEQITPLIEPKFDNIKHILENKVRELSATVDDSLNAIMISQNSFISSCNRIQAEEKQMYDILDNTLIEMRNKSNYDLKIITDKIGAQNVMLNNSLNILLSEVVTITDKIFSGMKKLVIDNNGFRSSDSEPMSLNKGHCLLTRDDLSNICHRVYDTSYGQTNHETNGKSDELLPPITSNKTLISNTDFENDYEISSETQNSEYNTN